MSKSLRLVLLTAALLTVGTSVTVMLHAGAPARQTPTLEYTVLDGSKHTTAQWRGQVVVVTFWATTCAVCVAEMPHWVNLYARYRDRGLGYLAVAMPYDPPVRVIEFARSRQLPFPVAIDLQGTMAHGFFDTDVTPTTYVLNKRGEVAQSFLGRPNFDELNALVERLLASS